MRATRWLGSVLGVVGAAAIIVSCGGTGGGSGSKGNPSQQFVLNSNNSGRLTLNVNPNEVDANKSDRLGLVAQLTDSTGQGISGVLITFTSDVDDLDPSRPGDITFIPNQVNGNGQNFGQAVTDASGRADIIAVAGSFPTGTGDIIGTGAIFAEPPIPFGLSAQVQVTLYDVGFIDTVDGQLNVIPSTLELVEPVPNSVFFFNIVGGTPPYQLKNEVNGQGAATIGQHCAPGCTENGGVLCVGSPCQSDGDCNEGGSPTPADVCVGPIKRCLASCRGTNCGGSRCDTDADCNDGSSTPADVCKDSGQSIAFTLNDNPASDTQGFTVEDSIGGSINVAVTISYVCGNGVARGTEDCDFASVNDNVCATYGLPSGCTLDQVGTGFCLSQGITNPTTRNVDCNECQLTLDCQGTGGTPVGGATATPGGGPTATSATVTPTPALTPTPANTATPGVGVPSNLTLALVTNGSGDNGNATLTTVISATVTDSNGNPVPDNVNVFFSLSGPTQGASINSPSGTNQEPPCDVTSFESQDQGTGVDVFAQPGVAHTCVIYPVGAAGAGITINAVSGAASDSQGFTLPAAP